MKTPSLKSCKVCESDISPHAPFCRSCGHPQGRPLMIWLLGFFLLLMIALYLAITIYCGCHIERFRVYGPERDRSIEFYEQTDPSE